MPWSTSKAVGWFQGRMEFGPRALGGRSILGDARSPTMQRTLNLKVKYRESFRPFAPSVLREAVADWFELDDDSPYMLLVADVIDHRRRLMNEDEQSLFGIDKLNVPRSQIPAVTHVDYSARIQTVHADTNPRYHRLLSEFNERTGCPVLVNTSFNVRGEPIVCTPEDAFRCFMGTEIEVLVAGNCVLAEGAAGSGQEARLQGRLRARLSRVTSPARAKIDRRRKSCFVRDASSPVAGPPYPELLWYQLSKKRETHTTVMLWRAPSRQGRFRGFGFEVGSGHGSGLWARLVDRWP